MRPDDVREMLRKQPFEPFIIRVVDDMEYEIRHPEQALVGIATVDFDLSTTRDPRGRGHAHIILSLRMIISLEPSEYLD